MLDLDCEDLIIETFNHFLKSFNFKGRMLSHIWKQAIMTTIIQESYHIPTLSQYWDR